MAGAVPTVLKTLTTALQLPAAQALHASTVLLPLSVSVLMERLVCCAIEMMPVSVIHVEKALTVTLTPLVACSTVTVLQDI